MLYFGVFACGLGKLYVPGPGASTPGMPRVRPARPDRGKLHRGVDSPHGPLCFR